MCLKIAVVGLSLFVPAAGLAAAELTPAPRVTATRSANPVQTIAQQPYTTPAGVPTGQVVPAGGPIVGIVPNGFPVRFGRHRLPIGYGPQNGAPYYGGGYEYLRNPAVKGYGYGRDGYVIDWMEGPASGGYGTRWDPSQARD